MDKELECKSCVPPKRFPGCHSTCKDYIVWRKKLDNNKKKILKMYRLENISNTKK